MPVGYVILICPLHCPKTECMYLITVSELHTYCTLFENNCQDSRHPVVSKILTQFIDTTNSPITFFFVIWPICVNEKSHLFVHSNYRTAL